MGLVRGSILWLAFVALLGAAAPLDAETPLPAANADGWTHIGLLRVRDLTPFGILRLDFLPAHAITAKPGTFALEANLSWQNTFVLSDNVADYLETRGGGRRVRLTQADVDAILDFDQEAYFVDLELGLFDLTAHYRFGSHWGGYLTVPVLFLRDGDLDSAIEGFHDQFGFSTANRDLAARDDFQVVVATRQGRLAVLEPPDDGVGDPVLGARFSRFAEPESWNLIGEAAVKVAWRDDEPFLSSGRSDAGLQLSYQRFFDHHALYLTASAVYFSGSSNQVTPNFEKWIPTVVLGWERRLTRHSNVILQLYSSPSVVTDTDLDELSADKYLASLGIQSRRGRWFYRFALTENLKSFSNTPDVGLTFSVARVAFGQ